MSAAFRWADGAAVTLTANHKKLQGACFGPAPAAAPTIVLLHEGLGCVALWRDFPSQLAAATGCGVFAYSRAGYGDSEPADLPRPTDYLTAEAMHSLPDVLDAIGLRTGILLGHSDGATVAAIYVGRHTDARLCGLVLMAPHFFAEAGGLAAIAEARRQYTAGDLRARLKKYHRDPDNAFWGWNEAWLHADFKHWDVRAAIDGVRLPVLAIQGREDQYGTLAQIETLRQRLSSPLETLILDDCRHSPHLDCPQPTLATVAAFVRRRVAEKPAVAAVA